MAEITLEADTGRAIGSSSARRMRTAGRIPGVVYGGDTGSFPVSVDARQLRHALNTDAGLNVLLSLNVDGKSYLTLARELQRHPVRGTLSHVDFQVVNRNEEISADVSVSLVGEPVKLNRADGVLEQHVFTLTIKAKPQDIPAVIEVYISDLGIGDAIRVADLALPAGVVTEVDGDTVVAGGIAGRVSTAGEAEVEGEGAAAEGGEAS